jgi:hypothetical protein
MPPASSRVFALVFPRLSRHHNEGAIGTSAYKGLFDGRQLGQIAVGVARPVDVIPERNRDGSVATVYDGTIRRDRSFLDPQNRGVGLLMKRGSSHSHQFFPLALGPCIRNRERHSTAVRCTIAPDK